MKRPARCCDIRFIVTLTILCGLTGCKPEPESFPVSGKLVLKNGDISSYAGNVIEFQSESDPNVRSYGYVQKDGSFSLATLHSAKSLTGVVAGTHKGRFPMDIVTGADGKPLKGKGGVDFKFADFNTSGWVIEVPVTKEIILKLN